MQTKNCFIFIYLFSALAFVGTKVCGQNSHFDSISDRDMFSSYKHLSAQQLLDTANYYYNKNSLDTALICYNMIINVPVKSKNNAEVPNTVEALKKSAIIYGHICDYNRSYELLIKTLQLCEQYGFVAEEPRIYTNLGNIYYRFNSHDLAKLYYLKALNLCADSADMTVILNNLGAVELEAGKLDSAFYYLNKSLKISKQYNDNYIHTILNTVALTYQKNGLYDSAFYYFRLSLNKARKNRKIEHEANNLNGLGKLFFEINKADSALFYIDLSNHIAIENDFVGILAENYLTLSEIEEKKGCDKNALAYFKKHTNLKDSILNVERFGDINQLQRLYEVEKTNQKIEDFAIEQKIKDNIIRYQKIILFIAIGVLLLVSIILLIVFLQKRKLNIAYKTLFEKNIEIIELQESSPKKYQNNLLSDDVQKKLLDKILILMKDIPVICDTEFSLSKLAELVHSNHGHVSQVINTAFNKNFHSFLNDYRIQEAQRLLSASEASKYTIESIALRVGFKSRSSFYDAFKKTTGVTPKFYLKKMQSKQ
ncbi:MAG: helix-turn-helix domain-containing protein [Cytophagaceae bacterium]|jgi:AraC-like DNA-binding protein/Tfp pilus assembly protein PilF|nr:helix-turn-helix domain-containing protein [Cytophagaceae bacterium]